MGSPRGATPTIYLTFNDVQDLDLTQASNVYVTMTDGKSSVTYTTGQLQIQAKQIAATLTQKDSLSFGTGKIKIQANWTYPDGKRVASNISLYDMTPQLLDQVVT